MHVRLRLDFEVVRRWHVDLVERLRARPDFIVSLEHAAGPRLTVAADRFFRLERLIHGASDGDAASLAPGVLRPTGAALGSPDLTLDLSGEAPVATGQVWRLVYDGARGEAALFGALVAGRQPVAELRDGARRIAAGRLGTESPAQVRASFADALARTGTLILAAVDGCPSAAPMQAEDRGVPRTFGSIQLATAVKRKVVAVTRRRLGRLSLREPNWRIGWRRLAGPDLFDLRRHPEEGWTNLPDDGKRFYADPFPIEVGGRLHLFMEEYPYVTRKGIISAIPFDADGPAGTPEPVLELPHHLSYPFVFERDGAVWMVPESSGAATVDLFRATDFPGGWVKETTLIAGVAASDATLIERDGRWWLFATVRGEEGSSSDTLHLWSAPDFRGPWRPHRSNPVLIDCASARPAGRMVERNGALWRPVQDCRRAYGGALGLARVTRLDDERFDQAVDAIVEPGPRWPGTLMHTVNHAGGFEFIDGSGLPKGLSAGGHISR